MRPVPSGILLGVFLFALSGQAADTPVSRWTGGVDSQWETVDNWSDGLPFNSLGALFNTSISQGPILSANQTTKGIWVADGVGQDLFMDGSGAVRRLSGGNQAVLHDLMGAGSSPSGVYFLMDDSENHNVTFGPNLLLWPDNNTAIFVNNAGTLTIEGQLRNPNGSGVVLAGTNALGTIRIPGTLYPEGGGTIAVRTEGTVILEGASTTYNRSFGVYNGTLRIVNPDALAVANGVLWQAANTNKAVVELRSDEDATFGIGPNGWSLSSSGTFDVDRLTVDNEDAVDRMLTIPRVDLGNSATMYVRGNHGYTLHIPSIYGGNTYASTITFVPSNTTIRIGAIDARPMTNGQQGFALGGDSAGTNVLYGVVSNAVAGSYGISIRKQGASTYRLEGDNHYSRDTAVSGGRLIAAHDHALGFGGATRATDAGFVRVDGANTVLEIDGATIHKPITLLNGATLCNDHPGTVSTLGTGVAYLSLDSSGTDFSVDDVGQDVTFTGGNGTGAVAYIAALKAHVGTVSVTGGSGWVTGNQITLQGGGATQDAVYTVEADGAGAITGLKLSSAGYGYTSLPTGYVGAKGSSKTAFEGTGANVVFHDDFALAALAMTTPGSGYTEAPTVTFEGTSGVDASANVVLSGLSMQYCKQGFGLGGDGLLRIEPVIGAPYTMPLNKIGQGVLALAASNTYVASTVVREGALSAVNTEGSATGNGTVTVQTGATLAGSGTIRPTSAQGGVMVKLEAGSRVAPHVGTGAETATLHVDVRAQSSRAAMMIEGGSELCIAVGADGTADCLEVQGNLTLGEGDNVISVVTTPQTKPGEYTILRVMNGILTDNVNSWTLPESDMWAYRLRRTETGLVLMLDYARTVILLR